MNPFDMKTVVAATLQGDRGPKYLDTEMGGVVSACDNPGARYLQVPIVTSQDMYSWIDDFLSGPILDLGLPDMVARLKRRHAQGGKGAIRDFKQALDLVPALKESWLKWRRERCEALVKDWLGVMGWTVAEDNRGISK